MLTYKKHYVFKNNLINKSREKYNDLSRAKFPREFNETLHTLYLSLNNKVIISRIVKPCKCIRSKSRTKTFA